MNSEETQKIIIEASACAVQRREGFSTLCFQPHLETDFRSEKFRTGLVPLQKNLWLALGVCAAFGLMSILVSPPEQLSAILAAHYLVAIPLISGILWLTTTKKVSRRYQRWAPPLAVLAGVALGMADVVAARGGVDLLYADGLLYTLYVYLLFGFFFQQALWVNIIIWMVDFVLGVFADVPEATLLHHALLSLLALIVGGAIAYSSEWRSRETYLDAQIMAERVKTASRDVLTGLFNRRHFEEKFAETWAAAQRDAVPMALLLIDIDYFKRYNDAAGHQKGDACLNQVAVMLARAARRQGSDFTARIGGEEFAVILYDPLPEYVREFPERIHRNIAELGIAHPNSDISSHVTVSIGVGFVVPTLERTKEGLVQLADEALYKAKCEGRNRTCFGETSYYYDALKTGIFLHPGLA